MRNTVAVILAGGRGKRMELLCYSRPKPALPFAGKQRVIDFTLSNCIHSQIRETAVLIDYQRTYLQDYLLQWKVANSDVADINILPPLLGSYSGTADAVYQNIEFVNQPSIDRVLVLAGDHVYRMDYRRMLAFHDRSGAAVTVGVVRIPLNEAFRFGTVNTDPDGRITDFVEKSPNPLSTLASMGIYIFERSVLDRCLHEDAGNDSSLHDFGYSILPRMVKSDRVFAYEFGGYWQDIGTIAAYYHANMDLLSLSPRFKLDSSWPVLNDQNLLPSPVKYPESKIKNSIISSACAIRGTIENSILSPGVVVDSGAVIKNSIIMANTHIGFHSVVDTCILDEDIQIGKYCYTGFGRSRHPGENEITVIGRDVIVPDNTAIGRQCKVMPGVNLDEYAGNLVPAGNVVGAGSHN